MRLIDADILIEKLKSYAECDWNKSLCVMLPSVVDDCIEFVDEQPTAYDIDKVVEEIEAYGKNTDVCISKKNAIEIVKQGDVSDDVCEWKFEETNGIAWHCNDKCTTYNQVYIKDLKITLEDFECKCPYCGKKIQVVDR